MFARLRQLGSPLSSLRAAMKGLRASVRGLFVATATAAVSVTPGADADAQSPSPENILYMDLEYGRVVIEMRPELAPNHVNRIRELVRSGFYDGVAFHRVIEGFMAQTGDPKSKDPGLRREWGTGGSGQKLGAEFNRAPHVTGTVSMARSNDPNSADSQFFIMFAPNPGLNGQYTVWGRVISGMEFVNQIKRGVLPSGAVAEPDRIIRMQVAADGG